jgi:hypothetical protein
MNIFEIYQLQAARMRETLKKEGKEKEEYVRTEILGLEAHQITRHSNSGIVVIAGLDEGNKESALIIPEGHFYAKLSFAKKRNSEHQIGFNLSEKGAEVTTCGE